jgi:magnesium transporter
MDTPPPASRRFSRTINRSLVRTRRATGALGRTVKDLGKALVEWVPGDLVDSGPILHRAPGSAPGIEAYLRDVAPDAPPVAIQCIDYGPDYHRVTAVADLEAFLSEPRPEQAVVRWINVDGIDPRVVNRLREQFGYHTLAAEDVLHTLQRPKFEEHEDHAFVVVRQIQLTDERLKNEQVAFFCFRDTLISFQEVVGDVFDPVRRRIEDGGPRFRKNKTDYLLYALLDSLVDHLFPLLESYGTLFEELEQQIMDNPSRAAQSRLFALKRDLWLLRRTIWPVRELVDAMYRDESGRISKFVKTFLKDVYDHTVQLMDIIETYRETAASLNDLYQSAVGNKMNEIMKVLTIMASFFIPVTFVAGVYGMNFEHMPELGWQYAYPVFWAVCGAVALGLGLFFWRKGWIGGDY